MRITKLPFRRVLLALTPEEYEALAKIGRWLKEEDVEKAILWSFAFMYYIVKKLEEGGELIIRYPEDIEEVFDPDIAFKEILVRFKKRRL